MFHPEQALKILKQSIKEFRNFNYDIKNTVSQLRYVNEQEIEYDYDTILKDIQQDIKDKIHTLTDVVTQVLRIQEHKLVTIIKHVDMAQIQINRKNKVEQEYQRTIEQLQNQIGNLACKCTDLEMQLNGLKTKNKSLLQEFSTLSEFSNKKILELQQQKRMHKKQSSLSLGLPTQFNIENITKMNKQQNQIGRKRTLPDYKINSPQSRQQFKYKSPQKYNLLPKHIDACQKTQMSTSSKKLQQQLSFGCVPLKKYIHNSGKKETMNKSDNKIYIKNDDMNRRLEFLLTTLSGQQKQTTNNNNLNDKQKKSYMSTQPKIFKI